MIKSIFAAIIIFPFYVIAALWIMLPYAVALWLLWWIVRHL